MATHTNTSVQTIRGDSAMNAAGVVGVILNEMPTEQHRGEKGPPPGLLAQLRRRFSRNTGPAPSATPLVRGVEVAKQYLLQALLRHSKALEFRVFVPPPQYEAARRWFGAGCPRELDSGIRVI